MLIEVSHDVISNLTKTELEIIKFINNNEDRLPDLSIVNIAFDTYSSPASVSRAIRKCGLNGFNELRYLSMKQSKNNDVIHVGDILNKSLIECQRVIEQISIKKVLDIITVLKEVNRIYVLARGMSEYVAKEFTFKLQLLDFNVVLINDPNIMRKMTKNVSKDECVFIFSLNGKTKELIESAENASFKGAKIVTCSCNEHSKLVALSNYFLLGYKHEHVAIREYEVVSRIALNMISRIIIDYIAIY